MSESHNLPSLYKFDVKNNERIMKISYCDNKTIKKWGVTDGKMIIKNREYDTLNVGKKNEKSANNVAKQNAWKEWASNVSDGYKPRDENNKDYNNVIEHINLYGTLKGFAEKKIGIIVQIEASSSSNSDIRSFDITPMTLGRWVDSNNPKNSLKDRIMKDGIPYISRWSAYIQPKLDGIRCLAYYNKNNIILMTRNRKPLPFLEHIKKDLYEILKDNQDIVFDGEIYSNYIIDEDGNNISDSYEKFRYITAMARPNLKHPHKFECYAKYFIFDVINKENPLLLQSNRFEILNNLISKSKSFIDKENPKSLYCNLELVPTLQYEHLTDDDVDNLLHKYIELQYEGVIIRSYCNVYEQKRSSHVAKYKNFEDDEYKIVDIREADGDPGTGIYICKVSNEITFDVRPTGTEEFRKDILKNKSKLIGKKLTVRHMGINKETGIPRFPVGKSIRYDL